MDYEKVLNVDIGISLNMYWKNNKCPSERRFASIADSTAFRFWYAE